MCCIVALEAIHANGVVYRGLSPDTLLVSQDGVVILSNFQHARQNPEGNFTICGTPEYLAPEVVQQQGHGLTADFWTLGVVLYELFTDSTPFQAPNELDVYAKICRHKLNGLKDLEGTTDNLKEAGKGGALAWIEKLVDPNAEKRLGGSNGESARKAAGSWIGASEWKKFENKFFMDEAANQLRNKISAGDGLMASEYKGKSDWCEGW